MVAWYLPESIGLVEKVSSLVGSPSNFSRYPVKIKRDDFFILKTPFRPYAVGKVIFLVGTQRRVDHNVQGKT